MTNLREKLGNVQVMLNAPKGQRNSFGNYNYRSAEDILEAVKTLLSDNKLVLTLTDEVLYIGEHYYIKATATITDGTDSISTCGWARESCDKKGQDPSQMTGTASSYARKYALNGLFIIDDARDADTNEFREEMSERAKREVYTPNYNEELDKLVEKVGSAKSNDDLRSIYVEGKKFQKDEKFISALTKRKAEILANGLVK